MKCECGLMTLIGTHFKFCKVRLDYLNRLLTKKFLIDEYINNKKSAKQISDETNISTNTVIKFIKKFGLATRSLSESTKLPKKHKRYVQTCLSRFGADHNLSNKSPYRMQMQDKLLREEGISNVFQRPSVKLKIRDTLLKKYGVESAGKITTARGKNVFSTIHKRIVEILKSLHIEFFIEKKLKTQSSYYSYDIFIEPNLLIEVNGDYWHGNPRIYKSNDIILKGSSKEIIVKNKWKSDKKKINFAIENGFKVLVIWESNINENTQDIILNFIKNNISR